MSFPFFFSWEVHFFQLANFVLICILFAVVCHGQTVLLTAIRKNLEQVGLGKAYAKEGMEVSQRTDTRIAEAQAVNVTSTHPPEVSP